MNEKFINRTMETAHMTFEALVGYYSSLLYEVERSGTVHGKLVRDSACSVRNRIAGIVAACKKALDGLNGYEFMPAVQALILVRTQDDPFGPGIALDCAVSAHPDDIRAALGELMTRLNFCGLLGRRWAVSPTPSESFAA